MCTHADVAAAGSSVQQQHAACDSVAAAILQQRHRWALDRSTYRTGPSLPFRPATWHRLLASQQVPLCVAMAAGSSGLQQQQQQRATAAASTTQRMWMSAGTSAHEHAGVARSHKSVAAELTALGLQGPAVEAVLARLPTWPSLSRVRAMCACGGGGGSKGNGSALMACHLLNHHYHQQEQQHLEFTVSIIIQICMMRNMTALL